MHLFILFPQSVIWLLHFILFFFSWVCHFPHICFLPCPPHFLGTPTPWYQKSVSTNRWPVNSACWGSFHWWALQSRSPASRYLFWLPKICLLMCILQWGKKYMLPCLPYRWSRCPVCSYVPLWHTDWQRTATQLNTGAHCLCLGNGSIFVIFLGLYYSACSAVFL